MMPDFRDVAPDVASQHLTWTGTISRDVEDITTRAYVVLPDWDLHLEWGPCKWQSRDEFTLPNKGDSCLVILDNNEEPWIVAWWPFST